MSSKGPAEPKDNLKTILIIIVILEAGFSGILLNHLFILNGGGVTNTKYIELQEDYLNIYDNFMNLTNYYNTSLEMYSELRNEYSFIEDQYTLMRQEKAELKNEIEEYKNTYDILNENYTKLQAEVSNLINEISALQKLLNESRTLNDEIIMENNRKITLNANEEITLSYSNIHAGYLTINFTSTYEIFLWIGSSLDESKYYSRYPPFPDTSQNGSLKIPIYQDIYIYIKNSNLTQKTTVNISIKLTY